MYSTLQRLNHYGSISTTFVMVLLGLISAVSWLTQPVLDVGKVEVLDLVLQRGRLHRSTRPIEDFATLQFSLKTDVTPLLQAYNTKQLYLYLTASFADEVTHEDHEVVLWDRIVTRGDARDFRSTGSHPAVIKKRSRRSKIAVKGKKNVGDGYFWRTPRGSFDNFHHANITLHYSLMPYVGMVTSGVAATAEGVVEFPKKVKV